MYLSNVRAGRRGFTSPKRPGRTTWVFTALPEVYRQCLIGQITPRISKADSCPFSDVGSVQGRIRTCNVVRGSDLPGNRLIDANPRACLRKVDHPLMTH